MVTLYRRLLGIAVAATLLLSACTSQDQAESPQSIFDRHHGLSIAFKGTADAVQKHIQLQYVIQNRAEVNIRLLVTNPSFPEVMHDVSIAAGGEQAFDFLGSLPVKSFTDHTHGTVFNTFLVTRDEEGNERLLIPDQVSVFSLDVILPDNARILRSSIPVELLDGRVVSPEGLRTLPEINLVYSTAQERIDISKRIVNKPNGDIAIVVEIFNRGEHDISGLTLATRFPIDSYAADPEKSDGNIVEVDKVMALWSTILPSLNPGQMEVATLVLTPTDKSPKPWGWEILIHNKNGDLVAVH